MDHKKVAIVTGGAHGIGRCIADEFRKADDMVYVIDIAGGDALPLMKGIDECTYEEFQYALAVGVTARQHLSL